MRVFPLTSTEVHGKSTLTTEKKAFRFLLCYTLSPKPKYGGKTILNGDKSGIFRQKLRIFGTAIISLGVIFTWLTPFASLDASS